MKACCMYILLLFSVSVKLYILLMLFLSHLKIAVCILNQKYPKYPLMVNQCKALSLYSLNLFSIHGFDPLNMLL